MEKTEMLSSTKSYDPSWTKGLLPCIVNALIFISIFSGCSNNDQINSSKTSPEQAWQIYVRGWKNGNLEEVLAACAPTDQGQNRCRNQFQAVKVGGRLPEFAADIARGTLTMERDLETVRLYSFEVDDEVSTVTFEFSENLGWRVKEF